MKHIRGFTAIEIAFSVVIFGLIMASATHAVLVDTSAERVMLAEMGPEARAQRALRKITGELRMAGLTGEDTNGNGKLDPGEDMNENDELDADWNLADEVENQDNLVFNRRVELREDGEPEDAVKGEASRERLRLLSRESLELALYTFHYIEEVDSVVAFLPPALGQEPIWALLFRRETLADALAVPLETTLAAEVPATPEAITEQEILIIDGLTEPNRLQYAFEQLDDGRPVLVLNEP